MTFYAFSMWMRIKKNLGAFENVNPYAFLNQAWKSIWVANALCLGLSAWCYVQNDLSYRSWLATSAFLSIGPIAMCLASISRLPETRLNHILLSAATGVFVIYLSFIVQSMNPMLLGFSVWLMLLLLVYQSRLYAHLEDNWVQHEDNLAVGSAAVAFAVYMAMPFAPMLAPIVCLGIVVVHHTLLWKMMRKKKLALEQHSTIWPRLAKNKTTSELWSSIFIYVNVHHGISPQELHHMLGKLNMHTLLSYFYQDSVLLYANSPVWYHRDLDNAVKECVCMLDNRAQVIFDMYGENTIEAAVLIKKVHSENTIAPDCIALPDLDITGT